MLWDVAHVVCWIAFKILYRFKIVGKENIPREGAVIFVANHKSYLDPIVVGLACYPRRISFMAKKELFRVPVLKTLIKWLYAFPVKRKGIDKEAFRTAFKFLSEGKALGLFPEGGRYRQEGVGKANPGVARLALKTGVDIVPIGVTGTSKVLPPGKHIPRFPKIEARVGNPLSVEKRNRIKREEQTELADRVMAEIGCLIDPKIAMRAMK